MVVLLAYVGVAAGPAVLLRGCEGIEGFSA